MFIKSDLFDWKMAYLSACPLLAALYVSSTFTRGYDWDPNLQSVRHIKISLNVQAARILLELCKLLTARLDNPSSPVPSTGEAKALPMIIGEMNQKIFMVAFD